MLWTLHHLTRYSSSRYFSNLSSFLLKFCALNSRQVFRTLFLFGVFVFLQRSINLWILTEELSGSLTSSDNCFSWGLRLSRAKKCATSLSFRFSYLEQLKDRAFNFSVAISEPRISLDDLINANSSSVDEKSGTLLAKESLNN